MSNNYPVWYNVLDTFEKKGYIYNGLTLPFLLGATTIINSDELPISASDFFDEIESLNIKISVLKCGTIGEYVFNILDDESKKIIELYSRPIYKIFENIISTDGALSNFNSYTEVREYFTTLYGDSNPNDNLWSLKDGCWSVYSEIDKQRLSEIKAKKERTVNDTVN